MHQNTDHLEHRYNKSVSQLQSFCRGEMAAVETYEQAMRTSDDPRLNAQLSISRASHQSRVEILSHRIAELGGELPTSSGPWGALAGAVEGAAAVVGTSAAISVLEQGEDHGLHDYTEDLEQLDFESRRLVTERILPQQRETHRVLSDIKRSLS